MKTSMKLVVVAIALVVFATLAASCMNTPATTTTAAPTTTTTAPVTTTADPNAVTTTAPTEKTDLSASIRFGDEETNFTGKAIGISVYQVSGMNRSILKVEYSFKDSTGATVEDPINVGEYTMTATFAFKNAEDAEEYLLPAPMTASLTVKAVNAQSVKAFAFEGVDDENKLFGYYYDGCDYKVAVGELPVGLNVTYTMMKCDSEGNPIMPPQIVPNDVETGIPSATEAGVYMVIAEFEDVNGNYIADSYPDMTATLTVKENPNQVLQYTPAIDGFLDPQYLNSAHFITTLDETANVEEYCIFSKVTGPTSISDFDVLAKVYYLWDGDYVYVCMVVEDSTFFARSDDYVAQPDPWKNDGAEIYYFFGGYEQPVTSGNNIYPTYSAFTTDSLGRGDQDTALAANDKGLTFINQASISAVPAQRSAYFNQILCATTHTTAEEGAAYTYIVEMAIPAKTETLRNGQNGEPVGNEFIFKNEGVALAAGEFGWVCIQVNDLSDIPDDLGPAPQTDKYTDIINKVMSDEWKTYDAKVTAIQAYSNRAKPVHYNCIQFSDVAAQ